MSDSFIAAAQLEGVPSAFASARDAIDAVLRDRGLRRSTPADTAQSLLTGAAATAAIEGSVFTTDQLATGQGDDLATAAVRLSTELLSLVPVWQFSPIQALARIHAVVGSGPDRGQPLAGTGVQRLRDLAAMVAQPTKAPALVVAALVHAEICAAEAFADRNAMVARAAERLVLVATGLDPASVTVPELGHASQPDAYRRALAGYAEGGPTAVHQWLLYAATAYGRAAEASPLAQR